MLEDGIEDAANLMVSADVSGLLVLKMKNQLVL